MPVISRDIISNNFVGTNLPDGDSYSKTKLEEKIDKWKYFLINRCNAKKGDKILVGVVTISVDFLALCFAAFELSLVIVIADEEPLREISGKKIINPKMAGLMPLDILIWQTSPDPTIDTDNFAAKESIRQSSARKFNYFSENSKIVVKLSDFYETEFPEDLSAISAIRPDKDDLLMLTTSSGSTGTAKVVRHTHEFFYELCMRNSRRFAGNVMHCKNMHHGSSLTVFYLPSLMSETVSNHYFTPCNEEHYDDFVKIIGGIDLNHISFPYMKIFKGVMDACYDQNVTFPNVRVSLLSYIPAYSKQYIKESYIKEIESIFGSNETAGPLFLSTMSMSNIDEYDSKSFQKVDNFYDIQIVNNVLSVTLPVYDTNIKTNDVFILQDDNYVHNGRSDLVRINDVVIDFNFFSDICQEYHDQILIVTDTIENKIYLVLDKKYPVLAANADKVIDHINKKMRVYYSTDRLQIDKHVVEDFNAFLSGVKIDRELVREFFRQNV